MDKKPIRYFIYGTTNSGKTVVLKEWLKRIEEQNGIYLPYEGGNGTPILRLDYGKRKIKEQGGWISKKIAIFENMDNYREIYRLKLIDAIKLDMHIIILTRNPHERVRTRLNDVLNGFLAFNMDKQGNTIEERVRNMLGMMRYPIIKHPFKYISHRAPYLVNEKSEKKPRKVCEQN